MAMTKSQWTRINNSLPPEDRMSWEEYQASEDTGSSTGTSKDQKDGTDNNSNINLSNIPSVFLPEEDAAALQNSLAGLDIFSNFDPFNLKKLIDSTSKDEKDGDGNYSGSRSDSSGSDSSGNDSSDDDYNGNGNSDNNNGNNSGNSDSKNNANNNNQNNSNSSDSSNKNQSNSTNNSKTVTSSTTQSSSTTSQPNTDVSSTPNTPTDTSTTEPVVPIKTAPIDTILFDNDSVDTNIITDLLFENIGGQEILTIARYDTVNGQDVSYQPIKNLNILQEEYNPNNLLKLQKTSPYIFANYPIDLNAKVPNEGSGPGGQNIYIDTDGNLVIEFINLETDEQVDVQITTSGTIYEVGV